MFPNKSQAIVEYSAPDGITPALARLYHIGGYDTRTFAVAILDLVQQGHLKAGVLPEGDVRLDVGEARVGPSSKSGCALLEDLTGGKRPFIVGRESYAHLLQIRRHHNKHLARDRWQLVGNDGLFVMVGIGLLMALLIAALMVVTRQPPWVSAYTVLAPFWWVPFLTFGGLYLVRRFYMQGKAKRGTIEGKLAGYRRYIEIAMADRLDPRMVSDGLHKHVEIDTVYAAAFGFENGWSDPLVHLLEGMLPESGYGLNTTAPGERRGAFKKRSMRDRHTDPDPMSRTNRISDWLDNA